MTGIQSQNTFGGIAAVYIGYPAKEDEESRLVAMCASRGYVVAAVYRENDDKEAFGVLKRVIKDAEQAIFDTLAVLEPSRLGCAEGGAIAEGLLKNSGVRTVFAVKDESAEDALIRAYFAKFANIYFDPGKHTEYTSQLPPGYKRSGEKIVVSRAEANAVREIFENFLNGKRIADELLIKAGRRPLGAILRDRLYTGAVDENGVRRYFMLPQIVSEETFEAVREMLSPAAERNVLIDVLPEGSSVREEMGRTYYVSEGVEIEKSVAEAAVCRQIKGILSSSDKDRLAFSAFNKHLKLYKNTDEKRLKLRQADIDYAVADDMHAAELLKKRRRLESEYRRAVIQSLVPLSPVHFRTYLENLCENSNRDEVLYDAVAYFIKRVSFKADGEISVTPVSGIESEEDCHDFP